LWNIPDVNPDAKGARSYLEQQVLKPRPTKISLIYREPWFDISLRSAKVGQNLFRSAEYEIPDTFFLALLPCGPNVRSSLTLAKLPIEKDQLEAAWQRLPFLLVLW